MKPKLLFAVLSCLFFFSSASLAQPTTTPPTAEQMRQSPMVQQTMKMGMKNALRSLWEGRGANVMVNSFVQTPETHTALGISAEQIQQLRSPMTNLRENPEFQKIMEEMQALQDPNDPLMQNADEETKDRFAKIQGRLSAVAMDSMSENVDKVLTAEQKQKIGEAQLAMMGEMPFVVPNMFEALHLTDAQKQQMEKIKQDIEPEFEKHLETFAENGAIVANKLIGEMEKFRREGNITSVEDAQQRAQSITQKLMKEDPEFKKAQDEIQSQGKAFATMFKTKMFDVLTDEQWERLQNLVDNPPELAKILLKKLKEQRGEAEKSGSSWMPGPDSWKPGDPLPEQYRQERNTRRNFPRKE
ncbi:MAG: hypothetical protein LBI05_07285 [Planctomycetaceae bacterium]|jgi:hypothetical protein|nr:hypothetical protein [Planctomycetaceae bacterium]